MKRYRDHWSETAKIALAALCAIAILGCAPTDTMRINAAAAGQASAADTAVPGEVAPPADLIRLENLWNERQAAGSRNRDYPIGPGDVLTISVPEIDQLARRRVRVSLTGTIELPLLGMIPAAGLSEDGLAAELDNRLEKYMYRPQATVFVDEYHNREVAVIGAVDHPGVFLLNSPSESLLEVLTQAGGLNASASDEVVLIPARAGTVSLSPRLQSVVGPSAPQTERSSSVEGEGNARAGAGNSTTEPLIDSAAAEPSWRGRGQQLSPYGAASTALVATPAGSSPQPASPPSAGFGAGSLPQHNYDQFASRTPIGARHATELGRHIDGAAAQAVAPANAAMSLAGSDEAITIDLKASTLGGAGKYVNMPMRPGDVLIVPGGGDVMVVGWVQQPGRFQVGSGLTVLGAIGAAGGPMYAANTKSIALIRTAKNGSKITIPINLDRISRGQARDLAVRANDVIDVPYSGLRIGPYIFYSILTKVGLGAPLIPY